LRTGSEADEFPELGSSCRPSAAPAPDRGDLGPRGDDDGKVVDVGEVDEDDDCGDVDDESLRGVEGEGGRTSSRWSMACAPPLRFSKKTKLPSRR
jgi:hypothetical protein